MFAFHVQSYEKSSAVQNDFFLFFYQTMNLVMKTLPKKPKGHQKEGKGLAKY